MTVSVDLFRSGMRLLGGAVNIITTAHEGKQYGLTATAVCSLSADPPRMLACVNRGGLSYDAIAASRRVGISVLASDHVELAMRFAGMMGDAEDDRFGSGEWVEAVTGAPLLKDALVNFDCEVGAILDTGSHGIVMCRIMDIREGRPHEPPLVYMDGKWGTISELES